MNSVGLRTERIKDPKNVLLALTLVRDLADGQTRLDARTRGQLQIKVLAEVGW